MKMVNKHLISTLDSKSTTIPKKVVNLESKADFVLKIWVNCSYKRQKPRKLSIFITKII